jgi:hypothetical protein
MMARMKMVRMAALGILVPVLSGPGGLFAQDAAGEYEVKAAYLFNFAIHVEWPADAFDGKESPLVLNILGKDPCAETLEKALRNKNAQGRPVEVSRVKSLEEFKGCHILFLPDSEKERLPKVVEALKEKSTLIVGESRGLAGQGAAFNFFLEDKKVRVEVNVETAARHRLKIGAKLLKIARIVTGTDK